MAGRAGTPRVRVRVARLEDAPSLVPLFETFYGAFFGGRVTETAVTGRLRLAAPHESVILAEAADRLTGFASLRVTDSLDPDPYAALSDLFVEPESRRLGAASRLVKYAEGIARERGASHLAVLPGPNNTEALPDTNTIPIRRLDLKVGEARAIRVAWIRFPELRVEPGDQRYARGALRRYRFENVDSGYTTELKVDEEGLVLEYPGLWTRSP